MSRWTQVGVGLFVFLVLAFLGLWLYRVFFPAPPPGPGGPLQETHRVVVLNASGIPRLGARVEQSLRRVGYTVRLLTFPEDTLETSVILDHRYPDRLLGDQLQQVLKIPVVAFDPDPGNPAEATVVLGRDAVHLLWQP